VELTPSVVVVQHHMEKANRDCDPCTRQGDPCPSCSKCVENEWTRKRDGGAHRVEPFHCQHIGTTVDNVKALYKHVCEIERYVRALTFSPFPNPYSPPMVRFNNFNLIITKAAIVQTTTNTRISPGEVLDLDSGGVVITTKDGPIQLTLSDPSNPKENIKVLCDRLGISIGTIIGR